MTFPRKRRARTPAGRAVSSAIDGGQLEVKQDVTNNDGPTTFASREAASNRPQLVVTGP
jgi:hypothetical protein